MNRSKLLAAPLMALMCLSLSAPGTLAQSATGGGGGGGGGSTPAPAGSSLAPGASISAIASALTGNIPFNASVTLSAAGGGVVTMGSVGFDFPPEAFGGATGNVTVTISGMSRFLQLQSRGFAMLPSIAQINAGGPAQFSPNGTIFGVTITDSNGTLISSFPAPVTLVFKPNAADLTMAGGNISRLTAAYVIDDNTPAGENPNRFPDNTITIMPPSALTTDASTGVISANLNFLEGVLMLVTNPVGYVQTLKGSTSLVSSFDQASSNSFGNVPQFSYLQVAEPQVGTRLYVLNPKTNNYAYVNASDVGPSGPPPGAGAAQGLLSS